MTSMRYMGIACALFLIAVMIEARGLRHAAVEKLGASTAPKASALGRGEVCKPGLDPGDKRIRQASRHSRSQLHPLLEGPSTPP